MIKIHPTSLINIFILSLAFSLFISYTLASPMPSAKISDSLHKREEDTYGGCIVTGLQGKKCRGSYQCEQKQSCYGGTCGNPCNRLSCGDRQCVVRDHSAVCKSPAELEEEKTVRQNGRCGSNIDCTPLQWCKEGVCQPACLNMNCKSTNKNGYCEVINHNPVCKPSPITDDSIPTGEDVEGDTYRGCIVTGLLGLRCHSNHQCEQNQWCYDCKCENPCARVNCDERQCVVRDHLPVCKSTAELEDEETVRQNGRCGSSSDCTPLQWCKDGVCEAACSILNCRSSNEFCEVINHYPVCRSPSEREAGLQDVKQKRSYEEENEDDNINRKTRGIITSIVLERLNSSRCTGRRFRDLYRLPEILQWVSSTPVPTRPPKQEGTKDVKKQGPAGPDKTRDQPKEQTRRRNITNFDRFSDILNKVPRPGRSISKDDLYDMENFLLDN